MKSIDEEMVKLLDNFYGDKSTPYLTGIKIKSLVEKDVGKRLLEEILEKCLPKQYNTHYHGQYYHEQLGHNSAVRAMESNIKRVFKDVLNIEKQEGGMMNNDGIDPCKDCTNFKNSDCIFSVPFRMLHCGGFSHFQVLKNKYYIIPKSDSPDKWVETENDNDIMVLRVIKLKWRS